MADATGRSALELAEAMRTGELSPVEVCDRFLDRITRLDPHLGAMRLVTERRARAAAAAAEQQIRAGIDLGPLHGVPYVTKDLFDVAGLPTTAGSRSLHDNVAARDARVTRRLARAGLVLLGKTNTVEFAFGSVGINHSHGTPHNPWQARAHVPGGSSSGSAVAVAAGMSPLATGTDTACSVRTPAALCGLVGLKTTVGRISRAGVFPLSSTLDSVGPLARSVEDAAALFAAMQGPDPADPTTLGVAPMDPFRTLQDGAAGLRVGVAQGLLFRDLDPEIERAVATAVQTFEDLGASVSHIEFAEAADVMATPSVISQVEGYAVNAARLEQTPELLDPVVRDRMQPGGKVSAVAYRQALDALAPLRRRALRRFDGVDLLLAPTTMIAAAPVDQVDLDFATYMAYAGRYLRNCFVGNLLNLCGVSLPCGFTADGRPIGLMLYAAPFREDLALRGALAYQQATGWHRQRPDLDWIDRRGAVLE